MIFTEWTRVALAMRRFAKRVRAEPYAYQLLEAEFGSNAVGAVALAFFYRSRWRCQSCGKRICI